MVTLLWTFLVVVVSLFVLWRVGAWLLVQLVHRLANIDVTIQRVGIFALSTVCISYQKSPSIKLEVEKLWLSSCYLNKNTRGVIGICISGLRLQIDLPGSHGNQRTPSSNTRKGNTSISCITHLFNWLSFQVDGGCCTLRGGWLGSCILHITVDEIEPKITTDQDKISLFWTLQGCTFKLLSTKAKKETHAPCLAQITFSHLLHIVGRFHNKKDVHLEEITTKLIRPQINMQTAFFNILPAMTYHKSPQVEIKKVDEKGVNFLHRIPQKLDIHVSDVEVKLTEEESCREVGFSLKLVQATSLLNIQDECIYGKAELHIKELEAKSNVINICSIHLLQINAKADDTDICVSCQLLSSFLGYHHDEMHHWLDVVSPGHQSAYKDHPSPRRKKRTEGDVHGWFGWRPLRLNLDIKKTSSAVAVSGCSGLKLGIGEGKLSWTITPRQGGPSDYKLSLEVNSLYIKLTEGGAPSSELSGHKHYYNTLLYIGLLVIKDQHTAMSVCYGIIFDNTRLELSTHGLHVVDTLASKILPSLQQSSGSSGSSTSKRIVPEAQLPQYLDNKGHAPRTDVLEVNSQCTNITVFITYEDKVSTVLRLDEVMFSMKQTSFSLSTKLLKVAYCSSIKKVFNISRATEMHNSVAQLRQLSLTADLQKKNLELLITEEASLDWSMSLHLCVLEVVRGLISIKQTFSQFKTKQTKLTVDRSNTPWSINVQLPCTTHIQLLLQKQHKISIRSPKCVFVRQEHCTKLSLEELSISCDDHDMFTLLDFNISGSANGELSMERQCFKQLKLTHNHSWIVNIALFKVTFPYGYNFSACLEEVKNLNKWRKLVHGIVKKPFTVDSPLPADIQIKAKSIHIQIDDDPFEVKLGDNYKLICDEYMEHKKRVQTLNQRIHDLRKKHGLLPASKVEELYTSLELSRGDHYIHRSRCMYGSAPPRTVLWYWLIDDLELTVLADPTLHGTENVISNMKAIDLDSPFAENGLDFVTLWCRAVNMSCDNFIVGFRDYPLSLINIETLHVWGRLIGAEEKGDTNAQRQCVIDQGHYWGTVTIERNMPALKFYHDLCGDVNIFNIAYGGCWEPAMAQFNLCLNLINRPSVDPSRPLSIWDKLRLLLHGQLTLSVKKMSWIYHASLDPYNKTEMMDWTWTELLLDWTNAKWVLQGDLDIYARTASKYDDCRLLHLPNLRCCIQLQWLTVGNPFDHHSVMPCAPDKQTNQEQDSYALFRSQGLNMTVSFVTKPKENDMPCCLFYASTLRWMDKVKMCLARVSRPIKRGLLFNYTVPRKPPFTRHIRDLVFSLALHGFEIDYWASFARQTGVEATGGRTLTDIGLHLSLNQIEDGLIHRPRADWNIQQFKAEVMDFTVWLIRAKRNKAQKADTSLQDSLSKSYLISVDRVSYQRADPDKYMDTMTASESVASETDLALHRLQVHNLCGAWTPSNRDTALDMYDAYVKSQRTKKNLSSEALHCFKVDSTHQKMNKSLNTSGAKTLCLLSSPTQVFKQHDHGLSMLEQLVSESDTKFVAATEEMPEPDLLVKQLHGIAVCDTDDVLRKNWHVELYNSQVVLRGVETSGYMIVSAAKASLLTCDHRPIWKGQRLKSKSTLVGSVESMQYYATVKSEDDIVWLSEENISEQKESNSQSGLEAMIGLADMVGSGHSVGGVVSNDMSICGSTSKSSVQLQRIVSRCHCEFFYADYGEVEDTTLLEVPQPPNDAESNMLKHPEGVDCFTLLHHELNICTNSLQYDMILDIVNNLMLYVEPKKKELTEKLENMRFSLQLGSIEDQRTPILQRQNMLRELLLEMRNIEKQLYNLQRLSDNQGHSNDLLTRSQDLQKQLEVCKDQVNALSEELAIMVSCFKESQLQVKRHHKSATAHREPSVTRQYEVCFKHAEWRMTEDDGQIGIADLILKNFLYKKTSCEDNSGAHQLDIGWIKVTNLLPGTPYREVLVPCDPQGKVLSERLPCLRILCRFKAPVGGISVKEHFEVNVAPLTIQLTARFYRTAMAYFFREKQDDTDESDTDEIPTSLMENYPSQSGFGRSHKKDNRQEGQHDIHRDRTGPTNLVRDIDKMKERAAKNNMFLYIKIPEVPLRVSYKGDKEKNITNIHDFQFLLPTLEYHDQTWTWHDLILVLKNDCKKRLIAQAVQQKLHLKLHLFDCGEEDVQEDSDKAMLLMGPKLVGPPDKSRKKGLFGIKKS